MPSGNFYPHGENTPRHCYLSHILSAAHIPIGEKTLKTRNASSKSNKAEELSNINFTSPPPQSTSSQPLSNLFDPAYEQYQAQSHFNEIPLLITPSKGAEAAAEQLFQTNNSCHSPIPFEILSSEIEHLINSHQFPTLLYLEYSRHCFHSNNSLREPPVPLISNSRRHIKRPMPSLSLVIAFPSKSKLRRKGSQPQKLKSQRWTIKKQRQRRQQKPGP